MKTKKIKAKKTIIITFSILLIGVLAAYATVKNLDTGIHEFIEYKLTKELDLSDYQVSRLNKLKDEIKSERLSHKDSCKTELEPLKANFINGTLDEEKVNDMIANKKNHIKEMIPLWVNRISEVHEILNPDQRQKLVHMIETFHDRYESRHSEAPFHNDELFRQKMKEYVVEKVEARLELTETQKEWFVSFADELYAKKGDIKTRVHDKKEKVLNELKKQFLSADINKDALTQTIQGAIPFNLADELSVVQKIKEIETRLSRQQREELLVLLEEMKEMHGHGRKHGHFFKHHFASNN